MENHNIHIGVAGVSFRNFVPIKSSIRNQFFKLKSAQFIV